MAQETLHNRLVTALKARGAVEINLTTISGHTVLRRKGCDWHYYVSKTGHLRTGLDFRKSTPAELLRRELLKETKQRGGKKCSQDVATGTGSGVVGS